MIDARQCVDNEPVYLVVLLPVTSLDILSFCGSRGKAVLQCWIRVALVAWPLTAEVLA